MLSNPFKRKALDTLVSLTGTQRFAHQIGRPFDFIPKLMIPRLAHGGKISWIEAEEIIKNIPSLEAGPWAQYCLDRGQEYLRRGQLQTATMCFILGSFPRDTLESRKRCYEMQRESFLYWCQENGYAFEPQEILTPLGHMRFYLFISPKSEGPSPLLIFINGLEGSSEELAFSVEKYLNMGTSFALCSVPGSWDYDRPMDTHSEIYFKTLLNFLEKDPRIDKNKIGAVGFSFGAFWTYLITQADTRIKFAVCNGIPFVRTFSPKTLFGLNPVIAQSLLKVWGIQDMISLQWKMLQLIGRGLALRGSSKAPIFAMNGSDDDIVDVDDTVDLGTRKGNQLVLIPGGGHCGIFKYDKMRNIMMSWILKQLNTPL